MKAVIQRVKHASVTIDNKLCSEIGSGLLVLFGAGKEDESEDSFARAEKFSEKLYKMRIFPDENGKTNLSLKDVNGGLLIVSQFTLYADTAHGNRPSFIGAANPEKAEKLYEYFLSQCRKYIPDTKSGIFGADMKVELLNDGPFTVLTEF